MTKMFFIFLLFFHLTYAQNISTVATAIGESRKQACKEALLVAQREALQQSGINIFTEFSAVKTMSNEEAKKIVSSTTQTSFGLIKTLSKKEKLSLDEETGYISCTINGRFDVNTDKLKSQLLAVQRKYENDQKEEQARTNVIEKRDALLAKFNHLKTNLAKGETFEFTLTDYCGSELSLKACKKKMKNKATQAFIDKLMTKYEISAKLINTHSVSLQKDIQIANQDEQLIAKYSGNIKGKVISVKNPYLSEINELNQLLKQPIIQDNNIAIDNKPARNTQAPNVSRPPRNYLDVYRSTQNYQYATILNKNTSNIAIKYTHIGKDAVFLGMSGFSSYELGMIEQFVDFGKYQSETGYLAQVSLGLMRQIKMGFIVLNPSIELNTLAINQLYKSQNNATNLSLYQMSLSPRLDIAFNILSPLGIYLSATRNYPLYNTSSFEINQKVFKAPLELKNLSIEAGVHYAF